MLCLRSAAAQCQTTRRFHLRAAVPLSQPASVEHSVLKIDFGGNKKAGDGKSVARVEEVGVLEIAARPTAISPKIVIFPLDGLIFRGRTPKRGPFNPACSTTSRVAPGGATMWRRDTLGRV